MLDLILFPGLSGIQFQQVEDASGIRNIGIEMFVGQTGEVSKRFSICGKSAKKGFPIGRGIPGAGLQQIVQFLCCCQ